MQLVLVAVVTLLAGYGSAQPADIPPPLDQASASSTGESDNWQTNGVSADSDPGSSDADYSTDSSGTTNNLNYNSGATWPSDLLASESTSNSASRGIEVGDTSSFYDWSMPDIGQSDSEYWETLPLTWMGEFDPDWTSNMPYPALGTAFRPTTAGEKELRPYREFVLDSTTVSPMDNKEWYRKPKCPKHICLNITIRSQYGALTDFEAFVLSRIESKIELESDAFTVDGPARLIRGQLTEEELGLIRNGEDVSPTTGSFSLSFSNSSNNVHLLTSSETSWIMYPRYENDAEEIDVVLGFSQLFTLFPGYNALNESMKSSGPFYSDDPNDQIILRILGRRPDYITSTSGMFPVIVSSIGSSLFTVEYSTSMSAWDNQTVNIDLSFTRKKYGGIPPWLPGDVGSECKASLAKLMENTEVARCIQAYLTGERVRWLFEDNFAGYKSSIPLGAWFDRCFGMQYLQDPPSLAYSNFPDVGDDSGMPFENESYVGSYRNDATIDWDVGSDGGSAFEDIDGFASWRSKALKIVKESDEAIRDLIALNCSIGSRELPIAAGWMNAILYEAPCVQIEFPRPEYSFSLRLELGDEIYSTPALSSNFSDSDIADIIRWSLPNVSDYEFDIAVIMSDNLGVIAELERRNNWLRQRFPFLSSEFSSSSSRSSIEGEAERYEGPKLRWSRHSDSSNSYNWPSDGSSSFYGGDGDDQLGPDAGGGHSYHYREFGPDAPKLYEVPSPKYIVKVEFRNVSITPEVWGVYSEDEQWDFTANVQGQSITLQSIPLQVSSFEYVAPPPDLDLDWHEGSGSTCNECFGLGQQCLEDEDCRFGLKEYLVLLLGKIKVDRDSSQLNITNIFRTAWNYFPYNGYVMMGKVLTCFATRSPPCNLDYPRQQRNKYDGSTSLAPPTHVVIEPATADFQIEMNSSPRFYTPNGWVFSYNEHGNSTSFEDFVVMVLGLSHEEFHARGGSVLSYNVSIFGKESNDDSESWADRNEDLVGFGSENSNSGSDGAENVRYQELVQHSISLGYAIQDFPTIEGAYHVVTKPWSVSLVADRSQDYEMTDEYAQLEWEQLREWLDFLWDELHNSNNSNQGSSSSSSSTSSSPSASSSSADNEWTNHSTVIPATGNSICPECQTVLSACVTDKGCHLGVRTIVLPSLLEMLSSVLDGNNSTDPSAFVLNVSESWDVWMSNFETGDSANRFAQFLSCLIDWGCALGYSAGGDSQGSKRVPTRMTLTVETTAKFKRSVDVQFGINDYTNSYNDGWGRSLVDRIQEYVRNFYSNTILNVHGYRAELADNYTEYHILYHDLLIQYPTVQDYNLNVLSWTAFSLLLSATAATAEEALSGIIDWFDILEQNNSATSNFKRWDVCLSCGDAFQRCMEDQDCHEVAAYEFTERLLTPSQGFKNKYIRFEGNYGGRINNYYSYIYQGDLQKILYSVRLSINNTYSWQLFTNMLHCLAAVGCDLSYMNSAVAAPATSHEPTTLVFEPTTANLITYPGTRISMTINGKEYLYTRNTDLRRENSPSMFSSWISSTLLSAGGINVTILSEYKNGRVGEEFTNSFSFGDSTTDLSFKLSETGQPGRYPAPEFWGTEWIMRIRSVEIVPSWQKLIDLVTLASIATPAIETAYSCPQCRVYRDLCIQTFYCKQALLSNLLPWLRNAAAKNYTHSDVFEVDFTSQLFSALSKSNLQWNYPAQEFLVNLFLCSSMGGLGAPCVAESCNRGANGSFASLIAEQAYSDITVPLGTHLDITGWVVWEKRRVSYDYDGDINELTKVIKVAFAGLSTDEGTGSSGEEYNKICSDVTISLDTQDGLHHLRIVYNGLVSSVVPHVSSSDPNIAGSVDYPARYTLRSTAEPVANAFNHWMDWLAGE